MFRYHLVFLCLILSACTTATPDPTLVGRSINIAGIPCEGRGARKCTFVNGPVALQSKPIRLFMRKLVFFPTRTGLDFIDAKRQKWTAPVGTLTDGASIPELFIPLVGAPTSPEFTSAAAIHDAYCGVGNQRLAQYHSTTWQKVHRVFYDALRVGGTPQEKAKIMFAAVYLGGPRWSPARLSTKGPEPVTRSAQFNATGLDGVIWPLVQLSTKTNQLPKSRQHNAQFNISNQNKLSNRALLDIMKGVIRFIKATNPTLPEIENYLNRREITALRLEIALEEENQGPDAQ